MAQQIQLRQGLNTEWTSTNPVLSNAEIGVEVNTGRFKLGNASSDWVSRPYTDVQGDVQLGVYKSLGDGSDGDVVISSGITNLVRDMYYNNLTINGTGSIFVNGYKIFVKDTLDLSNAPVDAINANGGNGTDAIDSSPGAPTIGYLDGTTRAQGDGKIGGEGRTGAGIAGPSVTGFVGNGGGTGAAGSSGNGTNNGTSSGNGGNPTATVDMNAFYTNLIRGIVLIGGGTGARGGASGGGDGVNLSGAGGSGGNGGGVVAIYTNKIVTSVNTAACAISTIGGNGGNGGNATAGICGGGGGGGGAGGGWIYFVYNEKFGPVTKELFDVSGGKGGAGGNGIGTIQATSILAGGGGSGTGGIAGRINLFRVPNSEGVSRFGVSAIYFVPRVIISSVAQIDGIGKLGGEGGTLRLDF